MKRGSLTGAKLGGKRGRVIREVYGEKRRGFRVMVGKGGGLCVGKGGGYGWEKREGSGWEKGKVYGGKRW